MYDKIISLNNLKYFGYNVHEYVVPETFNKLSDAVSKWEHVTIRSDHDKFHEDLPFFIVKSGEVDLHEIWNLAEENCYKLIVANGIKYDCIQIYNAACKVNTNGDFHIEACKQKVPLRKMYNHKTVNLIGNLFDRMYYWEHYGKEV